MGKTTNKQNKDSYDLILAKEKLIFAMSVIILATILSFYDKIGEYSYIFVLTTIGALYYTGKESLILSRKNKEEDNEEKSDSQ